MKKLILIFFVFISAYGFSQVEKTFQNIKVDSIKGTDGYNITIGTGVETTDVIGTLLNNGAPISGGKWSDNPDGGILYSGKTTADTTTTDIFIMGSDTVTGFQEFSIRKVTFTTSINNDVAGFEGEMVYCTTDNTFYGCISTGDPGIWAAFN